MGFFRRSARRNAPRSLDEAGPSEPSEVASLHGDPLRPDDTDSIADLADVTADPEDGVNVPFLISVAIFAVSAVYFTVQRILNAVSGSEAHRGVHPRRALVLRLPVAPAHKMRGVGGMMSPDHNLSFVVSEDFKLGFSGGGEVREAWRQRLSFVPEACLLVEQLLRTGARCVGKAYTEHLHFNLIECGNEIFRHPDSPGCVTGGEYSGCAVLVRASNADFAVALDTVGGPRIAAACCGVIGFKATYGSVLLGGIFQKSDALDSITFLAKEHKYLSNIGEMLDLPGNANLRGDVVRMCFAKDLFDGWLENKGKEMVHAVAKAALSWAGPEQGEEVDLGDFLSTHAVGWAEFDKDNVYEALRQVATTIGGYELKCKLLKDCNMSTADTSEEAARYHHALDVRHSIQEAFKQGIRESKVVIMPALMRPPPRRNAPEAELKQFEKETQQLHALATLVGCPQMVFPIYSESGELYSVSLLSLNKTDKQLLAIGQKLIPLTYQMLAAEKMNTRHRDHSVELHPNPQAARKLSEAEVEGERWREIGNRCYKDGEYEGAVVAYSEAIQQCPYMAVYYSNRAMAHLKLMQYEFAEEDCSKALHIDSHSAKALLRRGVARRAMGMLIEAQEDYEKVLLIEPNNRQARNELRDLERFFDRA